MSRLIYENGDRRVELELEELADLSAVLDAWRWAVEQVTYPPVRFEGQP